MRVTGFNPSSNGCGWKTHPAGAFGPGAEYVSILLLMDVAGKHGRIGIGYN